MDCIAESDWLRNDGNTATIATTQIVPLPRRCPDKAISSRLTHQIGIARILEVATAQHNRGLIEHCLLATATSRSIGSSHLKVGPPTLRNAVWVLLVSLQHALDVQRGGGGQEGIILGWMGGQVADDARVVAVVADVVGGRMSAAAVGQSHQAALERTEPALG